MPQKKPPLYISKGDFEKEIKALSPRQLDTTLCLPSTSFLQQIVSNHEARQKTTAKQRQQFNLANGNLFTDPVEAADYLLKREYGDTYLFEEIPTKSALFIPPVFVSELYKEDMPVLSQYKDEIKETLKKLIEHRSGFWFTGELKYFVEKYGEDFTKTDFDGWIQRMKILYLVREKGPGNEKCSSMSSTSGRFPEHMFEVVCLKVLQDCDSNHPITKGFKANYLDEKKLKRWLNKQIKENASDDPVLKRFFQLEITTLSGDAAERWMFEQLKCASDDELLSGFVVLHSCRMQPEAFENAEPEIDYLLMSADRKLIISIEVKRTVYSAEKDMFLQKPFNQLRVYQAIYEQGLGDQLDNEWTFIPILAVFDYPSSLGDEMHSKYVVSRDTDINEWLQGIFASYPDNKGDEDSMDQLKNVLRLMVFTLHMSRTCMGTRVSKQAKVQGNLLTGPITSSKWTEYITQAIEAVSTADNILFYSNNQLPIFVRDESSYRKIIISGPYGSGKTFLMREKAEILAQNGESVLFILDICFEKSLLQISLKERWKDPKFGEKIRVLNKNDIVGQDKNSNIGSKNLIQLIKEHDAHLFLDEWRTDFRSADLQLLNITKEIPENRFVWIVLNGRSTSFIKGRTPPDKCMEHLLGPDLKYSMRNSAAIVKFVNEGNKVLVSSTPSFFPEGCKPEIFTSIEKALEKAHSETERGILFLIQSPFFKDTTDSRIKLALITPVLKQVSLKSNCIKRVGAYFNDLNLQSIRKDIARIRIADSRDCFSYLKQPDSMLITNEVTAEGFEWPTVVLYNSKKHNGLLLSNCNRHMRCISNLIIINDY